LFVGLNAAGLLLVYAAGLEHGSATVAIKFAVRRVCDSSIQNGRPLRLLAPQFLFRLVPECGVVPLIAPTPCQHGVRFEAANARSPLFEIIAQTSDDNAGSRSP
jgi:hypothetical protein